MTDFSGWCVDGHISKDHKSVNRITTPSKGIPGIPARRPSKGIPDIPVIHDIQPSRQYYMYPWILTFYSILQLECIFYISTGLHRNSPEYQLRHYKLQTYILQRKGDVALSVEMDTHSRIEFQHPSVLSSKSANYKNDISQFLQQFE